MLLTYSGPQEANLASWLHHNMSPLIHVLHPATYGRVRHHLSFFHSPAAALHEMLPNRRFTDAHHLSRQVVGSALPTAILFVPEDSTPGPRSYGRLDIRPDVVRLLEGTAARLSKPAGWVGG